MIKMFKNFPSVSLLSILLLLLSLINLGICFCGNNEKCLKDQEEQRINQVKTRILQSLGHVEPPLINETFFEQNTKLIKYLQERKPSTAPPKEIFETFHIAVSSNGNSSQSFLRIPEQILKRSIVEVRAILFDESSMNYPTSVEIYSISKEGQNLLGSSAIAHVATLDNNDRFVKFSPQHFQRVIRKIGSTELKLEISFDFNTEKTTGTQRFDPQTTNIFFEIKTKHLMALKGQELCDLSDGDEGCCLRSMPVDFSLMRNWNFLIAPRAFDIYICTGSCAINNHARDANSDEYIPVSRHQIMKDSFAEDLVPQCCHPTQYDDITLFLHTPSAAVKQIRYENLLVAACGCD